MSPFQLLRHKRKQCSSRRLQLEQLECRYAMDASLAADFFELKQNGAQTPLDVLANDTFTPDYAGERLITSVSYGSEGGRLDISADRKRVLYTPPADFFGTESFVYAVDGQFTAQVQIDLLSPLRFDTFNVLPSDHERVLDVLANDPFWAGYQGARRITSVSVGSAGGTIRIGDDGQSIVYTPPEEAAGRETFLYVVDDIFSAQVTIDIAATVWGDSYQIIQNTTGHQFDVLANDPFWAGYPGERRITHVLDADEGAIATIAADGKSIFYTPAPGRSGTEYLRYVVDGKYEASVVVKIYRPVQNDVFNVDENSTGFYGNLTANDFYRDSSYRTHDIIDRITSVTQPTSGGTVTISADGQGIYYSPAPGFSGTDTFTYLADGVHEATVTVYVNRPVRDDNLNAIQDTPDLTLEVLANDFLGNGYTGAKIITSVGVTKNGGTVTIRGDGKAILYTPAAGYVGSDEFSYTVDGELEATARVFVLPLAMDDYFRFAPDPAHGPYSLHVTNNDRFGSGYSGPKQITSVEVVDGMGTATIGMNGRLQFTPQQAGQHTLRYTVDGKYVGTVGVWIANHLSGDQYTVDENSLTRQLAVMQNDFVPNYYGNTEFPPQNYQGPRLITGVGATQHGGTVTISADGKSVSYQPAADFYGRDSFTYTVDGIMTTAVNVEVIRRVRDDQFRVDAADGTQALPVLVNDLFGANYAGVGRITSVTSPSHGGTASVSADGRSIIYTPAAGYEGTETFTYRVDRRFTADVSVVVDTPRADHLPQFASAEEFAQFLLEDALKRYEYQFGKQSWGGNLYAQSSDANGRGHSETNVQVAGVDEGDIVEFDDDYVYMLTDGDLVILNAWPAEELSIASRLDIEGKPIAMFLHGDRLTVISEPAVVPPWYHSIVDYSSDVSALPVDRAYLPWQNQATSTIVTVIDVSDRMVPELVQKTTMEGRYVDSRGVGDFVYVLVDNYSAAGSGPLVVDDNDPTTLYGRYETREEFIARVTANVGEYVEAALPSYSSYDGEGELVRTGLLNGPEDVYRPLVANATNLISVVSFDVESDEAGIADTSAVYATGASAIYASLDNFYVFDRDYSAEDGATTRIVKFDWDGATGGIDFAATTTVAGTIINQFSADENGEYLRIATTASNDYSGNWSDRDENMLFVLREDDGVFEFVGSLQNLALNETMRSVRFLGDRVFVTTARTIDPLFAIDLSDPTRPEAVGHITLPGFTSYVHPVGENFLLTVGRNTPNGGSGPTQVSLFDVSNLLQPRRIAEYTFERFSWSESEIDHHAFGYFAEHGLLSIPTSRSYFVRVDLDGDGYKETRQSVVDNELAVFRVDVDASNSNQRLKLVSEISHDTPVRRSGYIGDKLYSIANDSVKVVAVANPGVTIAIVEIPSLGFTLEPISMPYFYPFVIDFHNTNPLPANSLITTQAEKTATAIENARKLVAAKVGKSAGAPLLVTAEATPEAPGGGFSIVFRVGETEYLVRASDVGVVQMVDEDFEFGGAGAWNAVDMEFAPRSARLAGDYDLDGIVGDADMAVWKASFSAISLVDLHFADGNGDGVVDAADYSVWRDNRGRVASVVGPLRPAAAFATSELSPASSAAALASSWVGPLPPSPYFTAPVRLTSNGNLALRAVEPVAGPVDDALLLAGSRGFAAMSDSHVDGADGSYEFVGSRAAELSDDSTSVDAVFAVLGEAP
jgi:uncharacterized secreted protein with C-terminal beta-propeller domain